MTISPIAAAALAARQVCGNRGWRLPLWRRMSKPARCHPGAVLLVLLGALLLVPARGVAAGLECPEVGPGGIPDLLAGAPQLERMTTSNTVDLANEINGLIDRLKAEKPGISNDEMINVIIAAYCPVVARMSQVSAAEKWRLMHRFDSVLMQQVAAAAMPSGSMIIASVPLPPPVFDELQRQAEAAKQTPAQFMAALLAKAAGR